MWKPRRTLPSRIPVFFRNAYVFDVEQTEGVELPAMREVDGDVGENHDRLLSFIDRQGIELVFTEKIAPALGMSYSGRIAASRRATVIFAAGIPRPRDNFCPSR